MSALDPGLCACGHYWGVHTERGCVGWRHPDHTPRWAKWLERHRIVLLLRCKCSWEFHKADIPAVSEEER